MDFRKKYLKYKRKYLDLKKNEKLNQIGAGTRYLMEGHECCDGSKDKKLYQTNNLISSEKNINQLIEWINSQEYFDKKIDEELGWKIENLQPMNFILDSIIMPINFNWLHLRNDLEDENSRPLFVLPGFSSDSLGMTISRITQYKDVVFNLGFSDIYVFDFTGIGGRKKDDKFNPGINLQELVQTELDSDHISEMYLIISNHLSNIISSGYFNYSILGRSAGGGLALNLVFSNETESFNPTGLNIATPGINFEKIKEKIINYGNKDLPIRMCWAKEDKKNPIEKDGVSLDKIFSDFYSDYKYYVVEMEDDNDVKTHRIMPILLENLK